MDLAEGGCIKLPLQVAAIGDIQHSLQRRTVGSTSVWASVWFSLAGYICKHTNQRKMYLIQEKKFGVLCGFVLVLLKVAYK